jgi:ADP-heptose:LPS heptosyltransferase
VGTVRQSIMSALPGPFRRALKAIRKFYLSHIDRFYFPFWLVFVCLAHRKRAVIVRRVGALGDALCCTPMATELRKRHPGKLIVFLTSADYGKMLELCPKIDLVYGEHSWNFLPRGTYWGLLEKIYNPMTTDERSPDGGSQSHLTEDFANSCGLVLSDSQPHLIVPGALVQRTRLAYGLESEIASGRLIIGINCGHTWPVREWDVAKWQKLVDTIHSEYDAVILQLGLRRETGGPDEYDSLKDVKSLVSCLSMDDLVSLIAGFQLLISVDSGPVHIAGAVGTPVVGLYGAVDPRLRLPRKAPAIGVFSDVPCRFCHHKTPRGHWQTGCPHNIRCMKELQVEPVMEAVRTILVGPARLRPEFVRA